MSLLGFLHTEKPKPKFFSIALGANYSSEVKKTDIWARAFFKHNDSYIAIVIHHSVF